MASGNNKNNHDTPDRDFALSRETWRMFRILSEFVDGFEVMSAVGPAVTVFGSARTPETDPVYQQAVECGKQIVDNGFSVITGGGPGIMEAANRGAMQANGQSVGLNIELPMEQQPNEYQTHELHFRYFFVRKVMFVKYACGFICFPGGFGTMDEFFESMTLIQTMKTDPFPVVCIGKEFWSPLIDWMRSTMLEKYGNISPEDLQLFTVTDSVDEAMEIVSGSFVREEWNKRVQPTITPGMVATAAGHRITPAEQPTEFPGSKPVGDGE